MQVEAIIGITTLIAVIVIFIIPTLLYTHHKCYADLEKAGYIKDGVCHGRWGCDWKTDYLNEKCCDCPYLKLEVVWKDY